LLYLQRSHDTQFGSVEIAIQKAHAAVAFQRPTKAAEEAVQSGRLIHLVLPGALAAEGGVPLQIDGVIVGGLGISGVRSFQDGQIAAAGVAALTKNSVHALPAVVQNHSRKSGLEKISCHYPESEVS
jgi:glc operon protein GlcG